jgi:L-aminopeptidase/D-esterase-like protein
LGELFAATIEATDEAVVNALLAAETTVGATGTRCSRCRSTACPIMERAGRLAADR